MSNIKENLVYWYLKAKHVIPEDLSFRFRKFCINLSNNLSDFTRNKIHKMLSVDKNNSAIEYYIEQYTLDDDKRDAPLEEIERRAREQGIGYITDIQQKKDYVIIDTVDGKINFSKLSDILPNLPNEELSRLGNFSRTGTCHSDSILMSILLSDDTEVVTGKIWGETPINKVLHSWLEVKRDDKEDLCVDFTLNAIINKSGYYRFNHIEEDKLNVITNSELIADKELISKCYGKSTNVLKEYLVGRKDFAQKLVDFVGEKDDAENVK